MATRLGASEFAMPKRDVSPLGASRFEQPFSPKTPRKSTSTSTTPSTIDVPDIPGHFSRPSDTSASTSPSTVEDAPLQYLKRPITAPSPTLVYNASLSSTDDENSVDRMTEEIEVDSHTCESDVCALPEDHDAWFMKQTEEDLDLPVDEGDECPDRATLAAVQSIPLYDADGNAMPFGSLYDPQFATHQRQLIIFVRYFYCGACQAFVKALSKGITMEDYFRIPTPTSIVLISCGQPDLIPQYRKLTNHCQFTILTEPTRELFKKLGMKWSMSLGPKRPAYMRDVSVMDVVKGQVRDIGGAIRDPNGIRKRDVFRGGNLLQIGGEFLFEDGEVVWCHRMKNMRGHAEIAMLRKLLELDPR